LLRYGQLVFSPNGKALAIFGATSKNPAKHLIQLWDVASLKERRRVVCEEDVEGVTFTSDSKRLMWNTGRDRSEQAAVLHSLDLTTGGEGPRLRLHAPFGGNFLLSPDDRTLIVSGEWTSLELKELATTKTRAIIKPCNLVPAPLGFSPHLQHILFVNHESFVQVFDAFTGQRLGNLQGHRGRITSLVMSPDGRWFATISNDTTVLIWDTEAVLAKMRGTPMKVTGQELHQLWADLAGEDAVKAYRAIGRLTRAPEQAVAWVRQHLRPAKAVDDKRLERLLADLDRKEFRVRDQARREIERMGDLAHSALEKVLAGQPSLEVRKRVERLMEKYALPQSPEARQAVRAVELLEHINSHEARGVLEGLARGAPGARVTREAKTAVERQARRGATNR
jgi:hypothetical protein